MQTSLTTPAKRPTAAKAKSASVSPGSSPSSSASRVRGPPSERSAARRAQREAAEKAADPLKWFWDYWTLLSLWIALFVRISWLKFNHWLTLKSGSETKPRSNYKNKMVIIGDDFAFGFGDSISGGIVPGLAGHLKRALQSDRYKLRQSWTLYNRGVHGSTTAEWLPKKFQDDRSSRTSHFETTFNDSVCTDASVVLILLGFNDFRANPTITAEDTVQNIANITRTLRDLGKDVWVCTIANQSDQTRSNEILEENLRRNEVLMNWLNDNKYGVKAGPRLDTMEFDYSHKSFWHSDGEHLSGKGYRKLAKDFADLIATSLVKREFGKFRTDLGL
ncbi:SGNH hydrolase-type esterase domain-containing protein [Phlyctochytrium arcticum]|nr:SGNH hydrolase-type esterase domain-containing protein [Phlyctochytrium arcticum]